MLTEYKARPGVAATAPANWPTDSLVPRATDKATVVFFAHPMCPCTRASLAELERVADTMGTQVAIQIVFSVEGGLNALPGDEGASAMAGAPALVERAGRVHGANIHFDNDGSESTRFGSATSGQVLAYNDDGHLIFSGGITGSRGHEGVNDNSNKLLAALKAEKNDQGEVVAVVAPAAAPVFGCSLKTPEEEKEPAKF